MILDYVRYLLKAKDEHALHSPFMFDFYTKVFKSTKKYEGFEAIEKLRKALKLDNRTITITDFGAGSKLRKSNQRKISDIAKNSLKSARFGQLFHQIIHHYQYKTVVDLGTSLGITTAYLAVENTDCQVFTFEGCAETAKVAAQNFNQLGISSIQQVIGNIDETLPQELSKIKQLDYVLFDANHQYEPTIRYFHWCLEKAHENSCFVFDDIHWSAGMLKAWNEIISHPSVTLSINLFWVGIVFFRQKQPKQHFILK